MAKAYTVVVHNKAILELVQPSGDVGKWFTSFSRDLVRELGDQAPKRTGRLARRFVNAGALGRGLRQTRRINNTATNSQGQPYMGWVVTTTHEKIMPRGFMGPIPAGPGGTARFLRKRRGYAANTFVDRSIGIVLARRTY